ncbi:sigma 54-interacting transcriptional regulator [Marinimicrobium sp. ABcell2]|uniref:sigma 54-interacting transcriptional regulator n=1 Tax=Marinimicrobium sp. ABcell2 TaxID=3069751 RepID=UPI0027B5EC21|nr:sigma 54-interacting transcriptional regulator [Marinimicrobium sp. ABcell2]MDQ2075937.1 sigma 54-interacting transcriptional regulator [Marinimicrobium sp. ABcell2]
MGVKTATDAKILLVDDDPGMLQLLSMRLAASGYKATSCETGREALAYLRRELPAAVVTDLRMEPMDGMTLFHQIQEHWPNIPVIMLTAHGSIREAVEATQQGLFSFLTKPVDNRELLNTLSQALEVGCGVGPERGWADDILTRSETMMKLLEQTRLLARSDINVLISGESGTGKELLAQALHRASGRRDKSFVAVNCSAIPADLLESELFGHVKGAFTGAVQNREGLFLAADGGTLFLDEIGDMPASLQVKLLRVLQEQKVRPVGDSHDRKINVRVLSATHRDLDQAIVDHDFREDLYYRLNVASIALPPLRERKEDILLLAKSFLDQIAKRTGDMTKQLSPQAQQLLLQYHWPGNIRQLHNVIEQVVALSPTPLITENFIADALPGEQVVSPVPLNDAKKQFERDYLVQLLYTTKGNISEAARMSGRNRSDFYKIMKRHDLDSEQFKHD